jgi:hypothetical protein
VSEGASAKPALRLSFTLDGTDRPPLSGEFRMNELNFGILIGTLAIMSTLLVLDRLLPDSWKKDAHPFKQVLLVLLVLGVLLFVVVVIAPPIYCLLLREKPLLLAKLSWTALIVVILVAMIWLGKQFFGRRYFERMCWRIQDAQYLNQKLGVLLSSVLVLVIGLAYLSIPLLALVGIIREWNNMETWNSVIDDMRNPPSDTRLIHVSAMVAAHDTCLYKESDLAGPCLLPQSKGSYALPYWSLEPDLDQGPPLLDQQGETVYVLSLDPDTILEPGWVRRSHYYASTDMSSQILAMLKSLFHPKVLGSVAIDLLVGSLITFGIVWLTKGAVEHYLLFLVLAFSMLSTVIRYSVGGMIIPTPFIFLVLIPLAIGSAVEDGIIRVLRKLHR